MQTTFVAASAAFGILCLGVCAQTQAAPVTFQGSTLGAFNGGTLNTGPSLDGLSYKIATFDVTTDDDGFAAIGNEADTGPGGSNVDNLGSLSLSTQVVSYVGDQFHLQVNFTAPNVTSGDNTFTSVLSGSVASDGRGGVFVNFDNTPRQFSFSGSPSGTFLFTVNDVSVRPDGTDVPITGQIVVPEPSMAMLGGLGALALAARRRRAAK